MEKLNGFSLYGFKLSVSLARFKARSWKVHSGRNGRDNQVSNRSVKLDMNGQHVARQSFVTQDRGKEMGETSSKDMKKGDYMNGVLENLKFIGWEEIFVEVKSWTETPSQVERATWLEVSGVPPHCWNQITFKRVAELWGSFEALGENALRSKFKFALEKAGHLGKDDMMGSKLEVDRTVVEDEMSLRGGLHVENEVIGVKRALEDPSNLGVKNIVDGNSNSSSGKSAWEARVDAQNNVQIEQGNKGGPRVAVDFEECSVFVDETNEFFPELSLKHRKVKRYGSLTTFQDKALTEKQRKKRDRAIRRERKRIDLESSELSGRSLSDSDLVVNFVCQLG
ncbi:hypothetical protein V6N13_049931 [Hibiscus sabdariffa]